jgi:hypothetical protein
VTALEAPRALEGQRVIDGPRRLRHEWAWTVELADGRRAVIAQLVDELAREPALRRRWVTDTERVAAWPAPRLAPTLAIGPPPDPRAADAAPPWRVRLDPAGPTLEDVLARAPLPIDEAAALVARLADAVQTFHAAGAVLRELDPRSVVVAEDGAIWFTDVGHARLAILSSRTASSLLLESSPYAAPEALLATVVDARADVYSLGVVLWRALTGRVPFEAQLVAVRGALPDLAALRPEVPGGLVGLVRRSLAVDPEQRPPTARDLADALRGDGGDRALVVARERCQACGAEMRVGLRLCLACGKQAVQFHRAAAGDPAAWTIVLRKARDDARFLDGLRGFFATVAREVPRLNFVVGDARMYSKSELAKRHRVPATLVAQVTPETGAALALMLRRQGYQIETYAAGEHARKGRRIQRALIGGGVAAAVGLGAAMAGATALAAVLLPVGGGVAIIAAMRRAAWRAANRRVALAELRATPAALPAADALVAQVAAALTAAQAPDVRARLEELAILVQRLADAKAAMASGADAERLAAPVAPLVALATRTAGAIGAIDAQLATLDEGALVRALARSEARREAPGLRAELLAGLDTLRQLEDERARLFGRLLELTSLMRAAGALVQRGRAQLTSGDADVAHALAALDGELANKPGPSGV